MPFRGVTGHGTDQQGESAGAQMGRAPADRYGGMNVGLFIPPRALCGRKMWRRCFSAMAGVTFFVSICIVGLGPSPEGAPEPLWSIDGSDPAYIGR